MSKLLFNENQDEKLLKKPARHWAATFWKKPDFKPDEVRYMILGEEICPKTGKIHWQGYLEFYKPIRMTGVKNCFNDKTIHLGIRFKSRENARDYCKKDNKFIEYGFPQPIKTLSILRPWQADAERLIIDNTPDGRSVYWYYDLKGGVGKSAFCKYMYIKHKALIIQGGKLADIINIIYNSNMDKINCVIVDIPRNTGNKISYNAIECILNGMITNTKYETGIKVFNPPHVIVFSNEEPELFKLSLDRWIIKDIGGSVPP